ncbi:four helix bundle protein [Cognataquiflexum rubidum]|uniref:four helix bundle protein n=1 Tax=Cognataquiflexum rubidum TaxID=2922273 RepID=UPI0021D435E9|nr:four helix bundle protein [Cognataquiflexum rubidum]MCH6236335.1 four helix bundle protein [Cognataquiflexum rubidum]
MTFVSNYKNLEVYILSRSLASNIFLLTKKFPKEEMFSLTDQIRRSSRSVGAQIAESWAKRRYEKHFISKLTDADAEILETQHWIEIAFDLQLISEEELAKVLNDCASINRMLNSMINKSSQFCK